MKELIIDGDYVKSVHELFNDYCLTIVNNRDLINFEEIGITENEFVKQTIMFSRLPVHIQEDLFFRTCDYCQQNNSCVALDCGRETIHFEGKMCCQYCYNESLTAIMDKQKSIHLLVRGKGLYKVKSWM